MWERETLEITRLPCCHQRYHMPVLPRFALGNQVRQQPAAAARGNIKLHPTLRYTATFSLHGRTAATPIFFRQACVGCKVLLDAAGLA